MNTMAQPLAAAPVAAAACPSCGGGAVRTIYAVRSIPLHSCVLLDTPEAARSFPRRDLELAFCSDCGFAFNAIFDEPAMAYSENFEESQHFSETFNSFARDLAAEMAERCDAAGSRIVEIGCGKGEFLIELCRAAGASGVGIDPSYRADPGRSPASAGVRFIPERFAAAHHAIPADIVVCRHTLEHIAPVGAFLRDIRAMIGDREDVRVFFETPDFARVLREGAFWDIYYEHCSYFSCGTHADLFRRSGFAVDDVRLVYGGQYIVQYARPVEPDPDPLPPGGAAVAEMRALVDGFEARVRRTREAWFERIDRAHREGRSVVLWGGGSKAVSLVTTLGLGDQLRAVVDINPYKQGRFLPGTAHLVIAPERLADYAPDLVVVMNPLYETEISRQLDALGIRADVASLT